MWRAGEKPRLDVTTLNKVLWYADAQVFERTGQSITGARYLRHPDGPLAEAITSARSEAEQNGVVRSSATAPDVSLFAKEDIAVLDHWIERIAVHDGVASVEGSLDYAWQLAEPGEEIPMAATFVGRIRKPNEDDIRWGEDAAARLDLP